MDVKVRALFPGCRFLYSTDHPDIAVVEIRSLLGLLSGNAIKRFIVDRRDPHSVAEGEMNLTLNVMVRDLKNGRAHRARAELEWWCGGLLTGPPEEGVRFPGC